MSDEIPETQKIVPRALPPEYSWMIYRAAWRLLGVNYPLVLLLLIVIGLSALVVQQIDFIGPVALSVIYGFLFPGGLVLLRSIVENKTLPLRTLFIALRNDELMNLLIPYVVTNSLVSLIFSVLQIPSSLTMAFFLTGLNLVWSVLISFSIPLMVFKKVRFFDTFDLNLQALSKNLGFAFLLIISTICIILAGTLAFLLPLFFIVFPMLLLSNFLLYAAIFENLEIEKIEIKKEVLPNEVFSEGNDASVKARSSELSEQTSAPPHSDQIKSDEKLS